MNRLNKCTKYVLLVLTSITVVSKSITTIDAGEVGVLTLFGNPHPYALSSGLHFINPLAKSNKVNIRVQTVTGSSDAASKDLQSVHTEITLNYSIDGKKAVEYYKQVKNDNEYFKNSIIDPAMNEAFKATVANFNAEKLIDNRTQVSNGITQSIQNKLKKYGVIVQSVSITNFKFSDTFTNAIEAKVVAGQQILTKQNQLEQDKIDAKRKVIVAEADAKAMSLRKQSITQELVQWRQLDIQQNMIDKWNGVTPVTIVGGSNTPFAIFSGINNTY